MATKKQTNKEDAVIEEYFSQGLALAIRDSLKSLFSEPRLPDNPYYYLASALGAYVDQNELWQLPDVDLVSAFDNEGGLEVADPMTKLCRLAASGNVWGLPHVLRVVSREGVKVVQDVLSNSMPDSFFPGPMPFSNKDGYTLQVLASVQGSSALWRPQWIEFPELMVRCDVVVRGPKLDEALGQLAGMLVDDLRELDAVPVFFVEGLRLVQRLGATVASTKEQRNNGHGSSVRSLAAATGAAAAPGSAGASVGSEGTGAGSAGQVWTLSDMEARPDEFRKALSRGVLAGKNLEMLAVLMVDAPIDATQLQERKLRFEVAVKQYCFHFWPTPDPTTAAVETEMQAKSLFGGGKAKPTAYSSRAVQEEVAHYGSCPYEALYEGYFLDPVSAKQYTALFQSAEKGPYSQAALQANCDQLASLVEASMVRGQTLEGFRRLLLLVLLQDAAPHAAGPLMPTALAPLEDLLTKTLGSEADLLVSTVPNLLRMMNSGAGIIQGVVREMEAVKAVADAWPARREACTAQATAAADAAATNTAGGRSPSPEAARASAVSAFVTRPADETTGSAATLAWLSTFNMEGKVLQQLISLKPRVAAATGNGIFSGISVILSQLLAKLPEAAPESPAACAAVLAEARSTVVSLQQLLEAAALTLADALLERCRDVMWAMHRFGVHLVDSVMARAALVSEEGQLPPEWVLHVGAVTDAQICSGAVAERVATEGVMLQYAVDTKLDTLLSSVYASVTEPPMPLNPCRRLLHFLRAHAARLDLWKDDLDAVCAQLLNDLVLLAPPGFMYAARPPPAAGKAAKTGRQWRGGGSVALNEDDEQAIVYGSYAAVTLCDCRALQSLASSLGGLLSERHWQHGGYSADVIPALNGDACLSGALGLSEAAEVSGPAGRTRGAGTTTQRCVSEHPRFYRVDVEEHHQLAGPDLQRAAALWAAGVADHVLELHQRSQHIIHQVTVGGISFHLQQMLTNPGKQELVAALLQSVHTAVAQHPSTFADNSIAVLELMAAVKEGLYVKVVMHLHFNYRTEGLPMDTTSIAAAAHRWGSAQQPGFVLPAGGSNDVGSRQADIGSRQQTATFPAQAASSSLATGGPQLGQETVEPHWDLGVYQRVFLTESAAKAWYNWNNMRGDPAQPFHYQHLVQQVQQKVLDLEESGALLDAQKLLLTAGTAMQDVDIIFNISRAVQSAAQELRGLQEINSVLQVLQSEALPPQQRVKLDTERLRHLFLLYCGRLRRAMTSPKYCYFTGFAAVAPRLIAELKDQVLGGSGLTSRHAELLQQLNLWTLCCESSVASSIQDCFDEAVKRRLVQRLEIAEMC